MATETKKRKRDISSDETSDSSCCIVPAFVANAGHTLTESESDEQLSNKEHVGQRKILKKRIVKKCQEESDSTDSSVEIIDVKLPNQLEIDAELAKATQDLDTQAMWDRLCWKEELKKDEMKQESK